MNVLWSYLIRMVPELYYFKFICELILLNLHTNVNYDDILDKFAFQLCTVELQWLEHRWLIYHGCFEHVLESLGKNPIAADIIIFWIM